MQQVMGSIPAAGEDKIRCPNMFSLVSFAWMILDKSARRPSDRDVNWSPPCRENHALKERLNKSYTKRAVTTFFKSYPCTNIKRKQNFNKLTETWGPKVAVKLS